MSRKIITYIVCINFIASVTSELELGSECNINGGRGKCLPPRECLSAKENSNKYGIAPNICSIQKEDPLVCCATDNVTEVVTMNTRRPNDGCKPITLVTAPEVGQKSWNKCLEYQEKIMRPCLDIILVEGKFRYSKCPHDSLALILESEVYENEYPHMVLLGYGDDINSSDWLCDGVIISERFILAPAFCTYSRQHGPVKYIRTGVLNITEPVNSSRLYTIKRAIKHPLFKAPNPFYNIALLELDIAIPLDLSTIPACIDVGNLPSYTSATAIGWDKRDREKSLLQRDHLFKAPSSNICFKSSHHYFHDETTQICYNYWDEKSNNQGFENILQIEHTRCMYVVIGLGNRRPGNELGTSFTRVSAFVSWIESIVWP